MPPSGVDGTELDLEGLAASLGGIAADVEDEEEDEDDAEKELVPDFDVAACLRSLAVDGGADTMPAPSLEPPAPEQPLVELHGRARNAQIAREALARKRARVQQAIGVSASAVVVAGPSSIAVVLAGGASSPSHVVVPHAIMDTIRLGMVPLFGSPHLMDALSATIRHSHVHQMPKDPDVKTLVTQCLQESAGSVEAKISYAQQLGLDRMKVERIMGPLASCLINLGHMLQRRLEMLMINRWKPLVYVDGARYDETPLDTTFEDVTHAVIAPLALPDSDGSGGGRTGVSKAIVRRLVLGLDKGTSKLFQTETTFGMFGSLQVGDATKFSGCMAGPRHSSSSSRATLPKCTH